jgi:hypothetical protein
MFRNKNIHRSKIYSVNRKEDKAQDDQKGHGNNKFIGREDRYVRKAETYGF